MSPGNMPTVCSFCNSPASPASTEQIDFVCNKFLYHYFEISLKTQVNSDGSFAMPVFPLCTECSYLFKEIQRLASIWVEVQVHLFDNIVPEIHRKLELKDVERQLLSVDRIYKEDGVSALFRKQVIKLFGSIPDAVDAKRQSERLGRFCPVQVTNLSETLIMAGSSAQVSLPEVKIESEDWTRRHQRSTDGGVNVVTLVYAQSHDPAAQQHTQTLDYDMDIGAFMETPMEESVGYSPASENDSDRSDDSSTEGNSKEKKSLTRKSVSPRKPKTQNSGEGSPETKKKSSTPRKPRLSEPRQQIQCKFCPLVVLFPHTYRKHELQIHKSHLHHQCDQCNQAFSKQEFLTAHKESHRTDVKEWKCTICNKKCFRSEKLHKHIIDAHVPDYIKGTFVAKNNELKAGEEKTCPICAVKFTVRKLYAKHMNNVHFSDKKFHQCDYCFAETGFKTKETHQMIAHLYKSHPKEPQQFPCPTCGKRFVYRFVLNRHIEYHNLEDIKPLACIYCETRFAEDEADAYIKHQITCIDVSPSEAPSLDLKCSACDKAFPRGKDILLARHERTHDELVTHQCTDCENKYTRKSFLDTHMKTHTIGPFQCTVCPNILQSAEGLSKHLKQMHTGENNIKCTEPGCPELFAHRATMLYHKTKVHGGPKHICTVCNKEFFKPDNVKLHMERRHPTECEEPPEQFPCKICGTVFVRKNILVTHTRRVHGGGKIPQKKKKCETCGKLISERIFEMHQNFHKGIKAYKCDQCDKAFTWENNYRNHLMVHSGQRPHQCDECGKTYTQPNQLRSHKKRVHATDAEGNKLIPTRQRKSVSTTGPKRKHSKKKTPKLEPKEEEESEENEEDDEENLNFQGTDEDDEKLSRLSLSVTKNTRKSSRNRTAKSSSSTRAPSAATRRRKTNKKTVIKEEQESEEEVDSEDASFQPKLMSAKSLFSPKSGTMRKRDTSAVSKSKVVRRSSRAKKKVNFGDDFEGEDDADYILS